MASRAQSAPILAPQLGHKARLGSKSAPISKRAAAPAEPPLSTSADVQWLTVHGAAANNLKTIDVRFPLGRFTCVTGVSGSGKSSLVNNILFIALARELNGATAESPGKYERISGLEQLDKIIAIDQTPIGRTPRSNPATYIKLFDEIRALFTKLPDSKLRGYKPGRFSFNVAMGRGGGRCEACEGNGANKIEMDFLADVWVTCPICNGRRFTAETLRIQYKGKSIGDVLEMDVQQALLHFENVPRLRGMLQTLHDVGLDYIKIGQPSPTLSGGEAQRIKLARELVKKGTGRTIYVLDEPTTGLHFEDIRRLLVVLHGFVDAGNTVVVIEHNLDVIKTADWVIDLGPEGGEGGGNIVCEGTPEEIAEHEPSHTGAALRELFTGSRVRCADHYSAEAATVRTADPTPNFSVRDAITITGARQHNLKDITVSFPRNQITVCSGVSGSGKTSFAIDTVFAEGYRRYVESLSAYARQFLGQLAKPRVEHVSGLSPAICIEQKTASRSPRSTVGTVTEIYDYLRVLWARAGQAHCVKCGQTIGSQTVDQIMEQVMALDPGAPLMILAPLKLGDGEKWATVVNRLKASGYRRVRVDGELIEVAQAATLDARRRHRVEVVVDRLIVKPAARGRITESVEHALALGNGVMTVLVEAVETVPENDEARMTNDEQKNDELRRTNDEPESDESQPLSSFVIRHSSFTPARELRFSQRLACTRCGISYEELGPNQFSFNAPLGWCETCEGLGVQRGAPATAIIHRPDRSLFDGAIAGWPRIVPTSPFGRLLAALCDQLGVAAGAPLRDWPADATRALLFGTQGDAIGADSAFKGVKFHWRGFFPTIDAATRNSWTLRHRLHNVVADIPCTACRGGRVRPDAAAVRLGGRSIVEVCGWPLDQVADFFARLRLDAREKRIAGELLLEVKNRIQFLLDVGLEYLHLHRAAPSLSGGESQRIRLASQIGSGLTGVLYVLDEPTIGLHPRDNARLVRALHKLRDLGNTLLIVEHDRDVIASADRLLDFGPRAGRAGGEIVAQGTPGEFVQSRHEVGGAGILPVGGAGILPVGGAGILPVGGAGILPVGGAGILPARRGAPSEHEAQASEFAGNGEAAAGAKPLPDGRGSDSRSLTRAYLSGAAAISVPSNRRPVAWSSWNAIHVLRAASGIHKRRRPGSSDLASRKAHDADAAHQWLVIHDARQNNLKSIAVPIPLARFTFVTGVSGSGKSSLVNDIIWPALANHLNRASLNVGAFAAISGLEHLDKIINVDQEALGVTPASNPATYTGVFDLIRELFTRVPDSKVRGYSANRFSFNRPGGRCEACQGNGQKRIEMHFMADVWVTCEACGGRRYSADTLEIKFKGKSIADVLEMSVGEALALFEGVPKVRRMLQTLSDVGLDYVPLGQSATTLSGGEAQRVKLATELGKPDTGRTLYVLDEPSTGLHFDDVHKLLNVVQRLTDLGNTVLVVEHNLDLLKAADWIIDLGPEAGDAGGHIVALGTPEELVDGVAQQRAAEFASDPYPPRQWSGSGGAPPATPAPPKRPARPRDARNQVMWDFADEPQGVTDADPNRLRQQSASVPNPSRQWSSSEPAPLPQHTAPVEESAAPPPEPRISHTAVALAPVLSAGPHTPRERYNPKKHAEKRLEHERRGGYGAVGQDVQMPWQVDGRKWHLEQRNSRADKPLRWQPAALEHVIDLVQKSGKFAQTNWNNRASIEITAAGAPTWFMHALTGGEWLLELYFRVPQGSFAASRLNGELDLKTLDQRDDIQAYGDWPRVDVRKRWNDLDAVLVYVHDKKEIDTPAFRRFVKQAAKAYLGTVR